MKLGRLRLPAGPRLISAIALAAGLPGPAHAQEHPDFYVLDTAEVASWWKAVARAQMDWDNETPTMKGLDCVVSHDRYLQDGKPPVEITITHPVESGDYSFRFNFNLADTDLIDRQVETITVGGRPYRRASVESRIVPWLPVMSPDTIILAYGIGREMFRPNETYPWLPIEFLIPQFFEVEGIVLGISGEFEIEHGEYETRYEDLYIDMDGFKESLAWCYDQVNPDRRREMELEEELRRVVR